MKRKLEADFITKCKNDFISDPANIIARNAISSVGAMLSTTNPEYVNKINHIFLNSVKKKHIKATNQGSSGRCWMFAALNTFRHILINSLDLEDFEFSETYLYFWDKLERSNFYLQWFIDNPTSNLGDKNFDYMLNDYMGDGGWWNTFANLINKYGIVPLSAMKETFQSDDTEDMNKIINERLESTVNYIIKHRNNNNLNQIKSDTIQQIYNILVKFLGEPPTKFDWSFSTENESSTISKNNPKKFLEMVIPDIDMNKDFVILSNLTMKDMKFYTKYKIKMSNNMIDGYESTFFNVPIDELAKYAMQSINCGIAVWVACDVRQYFNVFHGTLDDNINNYEIVFGKTLPFNKGERLFFGNIQGCHAMALTGFNINEKGIVNWQVENSWGYLDKDTDGLNGFLTMSHSWFNKYVTEIVINKKFLSRSFINKLEKAEIIEMNPWDNGTPSKKYPITKFYPKIYQQLLSKKIKV
jgi:bleomycin hydrolase